MVKKYHEKFILRLFFSSSDNTTVSTKQCIEPQNPYDEEGGHYAGFEWAIEHGGSCDGNSESFNEGCTEYFRQLYKYNECISKK